MQFIHIEMNKDLYQTGSELGQINEVPEQPGRDFKLSHVLLLSHSSEPGVCRCAEQWPSSAPVVPHDKTSS